MDTTLSPVAGALSKFGVESSQFDLHVRGEIPPCMEGSLIVATSRRNKTRSHFARWHELSSRYVETGSSCRKARISTCKLHVGAPIMANAR